MSFFGFDSNLPRDQAHDSGAPGFGSTPDAFASLSRRDLEDEDGAIDFEDTYDGLGNQLDDADDAFNADTFGEGPDSKARPQPAQGDFDFSGQTSRMADTLEDEEMFFKARQPSARLSPPNPEARPAKTGYERYAEPSYIPNLEANASIWGPRPDTRAFQPDNSQQPQAPTISAAARKMMSLEEVEAMMRSQPKLSKIPTQPLRTAQFGYAPAAPPSQVSSQAQHEAQVVSRVPQGMHFPPGIRPQSQINAPLPDMNQHQHPGPPIPAMISAEMTQAHVQHPMHSVRGFDSSNRQTQVLPSVTNLPRPPPMMQPQPRGSIVNNRVMTLPQQMMQMSEADRDRFMDEEARRAKRNHKIQMLSKDNGLMTPQDKNFITRIQLQQLVTATGGLDEHGPEAALAEDFYCQVYSSIRGAPRQNPDHLLSHFAQTYLHQTGGRLGNRRPGRGGDSHMRRMEQQVQRAVEAAKAKPKNKQLVIQGSLGKISFSNSKTPKPLLNLKRNDSTDSRIPKMRATDTDTSRKAALRDIEALYATLLKMEDHERRIPPPPNEESSADEFQHNMEWRQTLQELNTSLWSEMKVMEPIIPDSPVPHPFIAILSHSKGKKLIPRVFRQIDDQQRLTVVTIIILHLDMLDVIGLAYQPTGSPIPPPVRDSIELFLHAVMPSLFRPVNETSLSNILGMVALVMDRTNLPVVVSTQVGVVFLTMFVSRAHHLKDGAHASESDLEHWSNLYLRLFDTLEPHFPYLFQTPVTSDEDRYVWQFLAAMGLGASPEQQQRLVIGVKDRVMEAVSLSRSLPADVAAPRLASVNLFMHAIGLDTDLLD